MRSFSLSLSVRSSRLWVNERERREVSRFGSEKYSWKSNSRGGGLKVMGSLSGRGFRDQRSSVVLLDLQTRVEASRGNRVAKRESVFELLSLFSERDRAFIVSFRQLAVVPRSRTKFPKDLPSGASKNASNRRKQLIYINATSKISKNNSSKNFNDNGKK